MPKMEFTTEQYQEATRVYRKDLLRLPILSLDAELAHMTLRPGIQYSEVVGQMDLDVELHPYVRNKRQNVQPDVALRELRTYFGSLNADFDPNEFISTILGHKARQAMSDGLETTVSAQEVVAMIPKKVGKKLKRTLWFGKRNPKGDKTIDLCNGYCTIADNEIASGNISAANGNYLKLSAKPTKLNAMDLCEEILDAMSPELRAENTGLYCDQTFLDRYNRAYKLEGSGIAYNDKYDQTYMEGTSNKVAILPMEGLAGSKYMFITTETNLLVGCDQMSDKEYIKVKDYAPDTLTAMMRMFFGVEFESIDPRRLLVIEIPE